MFCEATPYALEFRGEAQQQLACTRGPGRIALDFRACNPAWATPQYPPGNVADERRGRRSDGAASRATTRRRPPAVHRPRCRPPAP
eukprot:364276-Chlamydomonas_euryale.AAC.7